MFNINQQKNARFIKKLATAQGFTRVGVWMGLGDGMGWDGGIAKIN